MQSACQCLGTHLSPMTMGWPVACCTNAKCWSHTASIFEGKEPSWKYGCMKTPGPYVCGVYTSRRWFESCTGATLWGDGRLSEHLHAAPLVRELYRPPPCPPLPPCPPTPLAPPLSARFSPHQTPLNASSIVINGNHLAPARFSPHQTPLDASSSPGAPGLYLRG